MKPTIVFIAIREGYFAREVLRGLLSVFDETFDVWVIPPMEQEVHLELCLNSKNIVGVIARGISPSLIQSLEKRDIPVVNIRGPLESEERVVNGLHVDDEVIGKMAGEEFIRLNLRHWGFVDWNNVGWSEARKRSFQAFAELQRVQLEVVSLDARDRQNWDGVVELTEWLRGLKKPCGILACNDHAGVDVINACILSGISVPAEVAVIGVDNDHLLCESCTPALSSIDLQAEAVGRASGHQLLGILEEKDKAMMHLGNAMMVVRESSHDVDRALLIYQRAMDYIRARAVSGPSVLSISQATGVSKRSLERVFTKYAERSPAEVVREHRAEGIKILLKNKSLALTHIAHQCGFSDAAGLSNFIKRTTGKSPGEFRL